MTMSRQVNTSMARRVNTTISRQLFLQEDCVHSEGRPSHEENRQTLFLGRQRSYYVLSRRLIFPIYSNLFLRGRRMVVSCLRRPSACASHSFINSTCCTKLNIPAPPRSATTMSTISASWVIIASIAGAAVAVMVCFSVYHVCRKDTSAAEEEHHDSNLAKNAESRSQAQQEAMRRVRMITRCRVVELSAEARAEMGVDPRMTWDERSRRGMSDHMSGISSSGTQVSGGWRKGMRRAEAD